MAVPVVTVLSMVARNRVSYIGRAFLTVHVVAVLAVAVFSAVRRAVFAVSVLNLPVVSVVGRARSGLGGRATCIHASHATVG